MTNPARAGLKRLIRPLKWLVRPVTTQVHLKINHWARQVYEARLDQLERQAAAARAELDGLNRYVPVILSSIQAQNAMSRANTRTYDELTQLIRTTLERFQALEHQVRSEAHGLVPAPPRSLVQPKVLNPDKLDAARGDLHLDLGTGHRARPEYLHIDPRPLDGVDVVADVRDLPFETEAVTTIVSEHLLELFSTSELAHEVLPHWVSRLRPGGSLVAVVSDVDAALSEYAAGRISFADLRRATFGEAQDASHAAMFTTDAARELFARVGLEEIIVRERTGDYEFEIAGRKPSSPLPE